jgi:hypothetical protein
VTHRRLAAEHHLGQGEKLHRRFRGKRDDDQLPSPSPRENME